MDPSLVLFDMSAYRGRIEPTLKDFFAGGAEGAILHLLQETNRCVTENEPLRRRLLLRGIEPGQSIIRLLTGQSPLSPDDDLAMLGTRESRQALEQYVSGPVVYELLAILCIPDLPGIDPQQNLGESAFLCHLLQHSAWIQNAFSGGLLGQGERLAFPLGMQSEAMRAADRERLLAELKSLPAPDPRAGNEKRVADLKSRLPRFGTAGLIAKVIESQAGRILPAGAGESVADRIANLQRMLQVSLSNTDLTVLYQM